MNARREWESNEPWSAAILAGGASRRMGRPKASLPWEKSTFLHTLCTRLRYEAQASEVLAVGERLDAASLPPNVRVVGDGAFPQAGPLAGVVAALEAARYDLVFVRAVDMPLLPPALPALLRAQLAAAGRAGEGSPVAILCCDAQGTLQPLTAFYRRSLALPRLARALGRGERSIVRALHTLDAWLSLDAATLAGIDPPLHALIGCNTPAEYERCRRLHEAAGARRLGS